MDHQTYKSWILNDELLSGNEETQLEEHLSHCSECARLKTNLDAALRMVRLAPQVPAPPDFTRRFTTSLAARKREEEKRQARSLTLALSSSALVIAFGAVLIFLPDISLISLTAGLISSVLRVFELAQSTASFVGGFVKNANPSSLVTLFVVIGGWIVLASLTLALSVWKLAIKKVGTNQ